MSRKVLNIALPVLTGVLFLAVWIGWRAALDEESRFLLPSPGQVIVAFGENSDALLRAAQHTALAALLGFGAATGFSFLSAVLLSISPLIRKSLYPYLMMLQMTPIIVIAPMLVIWVGPGTRSVVIITFLITFFPLVVNTTQGLVSVDRNHTELFRLYGASRWQEMFWLRVPAALPYFFTGLRIAAVLAPIGALVGDFSAGSSEGGGGLGFQVLIYQSQARYPALFATAAIACAFGFLFVSVAVALSWLCLRRWHDAYARKDT